MNIVEVNVDVGTDEGNVQFDTIVTHPLLEAASDGDLEKIDSLLQEGVTVDYQNENGWTPAIFAVEYHKYDALYKVKL